MIFSLVDLPDDEDVLLYCTLELANMILDDHMNPPKTPSYGSHGKTSQKREPIVLEEGQDPKELPFLWTSLMVLGPLKIKGFKKEEVQVDSASSFNPKKELATFGGYSSKSLYNRKYKPHLELIQQFSVTDPEHRFGYLLQGDQERLGVRVDHYLSRSAFESFFVVENKTIRFDKDIDSLGFFELGKGKVCSTARAFPKDADTLSLRGKKLGSANVYALCALFLGATQGSVTIKTVDLAHNDLYNLKSPIPGDPNKDGLINLCVIIRKMPPSVTSLNLDYTGLHHADGNLLGDILNHEQNSITSYSFEGNELHLLGFRGVMEFLALFRPHTTLNLNNNGFCMFDAEEISLINTLIARMQLNVTFEDSLEIINQPKKEKAKQKVVVPMPLPQKRPDSDLSGASGSHVFFTGKHPEPSAPPLESLSEDKKTQLDELAVTSDRLSEAPPPYSLF
ncbi:MAG: hypothetical protein ACRCXC_03580 [Legionella sp.]